MIASWKLLQSSKSTLCGDFNFWNPKGYPYDTKKDCMNAKSTFHSVFFLFVLQFGRLRDATTASNVGKSNVVGNADTSCRSPSEVSSCRTNLSPFTKDFRGDSSFMRLKNLCKAQASFFNKTSWRMWYFMVENWFWWEMWCWFWWLFWFWVVLDLASAGRRLNPKTYVRWMWCVWPAYLLGLLAKIKCSICSYQLNLWYSRQCLVEINLISRRGLQTVLAPDVDMCDFGPALLPWSLTSAFFKTNQFVLLLLLLLHLARSCSSMVPSSIFCFLRCVQASRIRFTWI